MMKCWTCCNGTAAKHSRSVDVTNINEAILAFLLRCIMRIDQSTYLCYFHL